MTTTRQRQVTAAPPGRWLVGGPLLAGVAAALVGVLAATWLTLPVPVPGVVEPGALPRLGVPVARLLLELGATVTMGMALIPMLVGRGHPTDRAEVSWLAARLGTMAAGLWLGAALAGLPLQAAELRPGGPVTAGLVADYVRGFGTGQALVVSAVAAAACTLAVLGGERVPALVRAVLAAAGLVPLVVAGHASGGTTPWHTVMSDLLALHVIAAAAWTGGLIAVLTLVAPRRGLLAVTLPRFSTIAGACLLAVTLTGAANATIELSITPGATLTSDHTLLLLAKTACLLAVAAIGWHLRRRLLPAITRHRRTAILTWGTTEAALLCLAYALAVTLARTPL